MIKGSVQQSQAGEIHHHDGGTTITGDAMMLMTAKTIQLGIKTHRQTGGRMKLTRTATITNLLVSANKITGKGPYKKSAQEYERAEADLQIWMNTLKAALPITDERTKS